MLVPEPDLLDVAKTAAMGAKQGSDVLVDPAGVLQGVLELAGVVHLHGMARTAAATCA